MDTFGDILDTLRTDVLRDTVAPYLWRDEFLRACVAQAHDEFAEGTLILRDSTSELAQVALQAGVALYALDERVLGVISAQLDGDLYDLGRFGHSQFNPEPSPSDTMTWLEGLNTTPQPGRPRVFSTDEGTEGTGAAITLRVYPIPTAAEAGLLLRLRIARLPVVRCASSTLSAAPECPRQYRLALVHGAAAIAYDTQDADAADPQAAAKHRGMFNNFIARARSGARTKAHQPLKWGFSSPR